MRLVVRLFGRFAVTAGDRCIEIPGHVERQILARLCCARDFVLDRRRLAADLWPEVPFEVSGNRLRTGLVGLRRALADWNAIVADRHSIGIRDGVLSADVDRATEHLRRARRSLEDAEAEGELAALAEIAESPLLEGWSDPWVAPLREDWRRNLAEAQLSLARSALRRDGIELAVARGRKAVEVNPTAIEGWQVYLTACATAGRTSEGLRRLHEARRLHGFGGAEWSDLEERTRLLRREPKLHVDHGSIGSGEAALLARTVSRLAETDRALLQRLLASRSFSIEAERAPRHAARMLETALEEEGDVELQSPLRTTLMTVYALLHDPDRAEAQAAWILAHDPRDDRRMSVHMQCCFTRMLAREWDQALQEADRSLHLAHRSGKPDDVWRCEAQRASVHWHLARYDEAIEAYRASYEGLTQAPGPVSKLSAAAAIAYNLAALLAMVGEEPEAERWILRADEFARVHQLEDLLSFILPVRGYLAATLGREDVGRRFAIDGLVLAWRKGNRRQLEIGLEWAAAILVRFGRASQGLGLLDQAAGLREESRHRRSPAEEAFARRIRSFADGALPDPRWSEAESARAVTQRSIEELESGSSGAGP
ncbi:MAG TPA: hypothetical protein PLH94_07710 [Fimbriimonadaceae bacterium]|nr:hypothetical protein [Fimbriimonadaceae bacterium]